MYQIKITDGFCIGLYCDIDEFITESYECKLMQNYILTVQANSTFVYFNSTKENQKNPTQTEEYLRKIKSNQTKLNMDKKFDDDFIFYYAVYLRLVFSFSKVYNPNIKQPIMPFVAYEKNEDQQVIVDYKCSPVDIDAKKLYLFLPYVCLYFKLVQFIILLIVVVSIKQYRQNLNGKCLIIYSTMEVLQQVFRIIFPESKIESFLFNFSGNWRLVISYDYWLTIR